MKVSLIRKDSKGIAGTYANAEHHALLVLPMVKKLEALVYTFGFKEWKQGHNVHLFIAEDGRKFDMIPYFHNNEYTGLQLRLRESRSKATPLITVTSVKEIPMLAAFMTALAQCPSDNERGQFLQ